MTPFVFSRLIIPGAIGALVGALVVPYAYSVQGGEPEKLVVVGLLTGAAIAVAYACGGLRLAFVGAAGGSIGALTMFQVPVCDGSHIGVPMIGAAIGFLALGLIDALICRSRLRSKPQTTPR